jgi:hypothetical protein
MTPSIVRNAALLSDHDAVARLARSLPDGDIRSSLESGERFSSETWSSETSNDYWVVSNGSDVVCFTVEGLTEQQAQRARVLWDAIQNEYPGIELDTEGLVYIVREVTGGAVWAKVDD